MSAGPFFDQARFMLACGQTVGVRNDEQAKLYADLVDEEFNELAAADAGTTNQLDGIVDTIVVLIGFAHSRGYDIEGAWNEVMRSNFDKIGPDGTVLRRDDNKILKPPGWAPPMLDRFLTVD
jgi:hypothetical protein